MGGNWLRLRLRLDQHPRQGTDQEVGHFKSKNQLNIHSLKWSHNAAQEKKTGACSSLYRKSWCSELESWCLEISWGQWEDGRVFFVLMHICFLKWLHVHAEAKHYTIIMKEKNPRILNYCYKQSLCLMWKPYQVRGGRVPLPCNVGRVWVRKPPAQEINTHTSQADTSFSTSEPVSFHFAE